MFKHLLLISLLCLTGWSSFSQSTSTYYSGTSGLTGFNLKARLHKILSQKNINWNYGDLVSYFEITDRDSFYENDGTLLDIYSENPTETDPYNYHYETPSLISGASTEGEGWNREHIVSQSFFNSHYPMYSDLHFVIPTDARVNQRRSNLPFGKVNSSPAFTSLNGSKVGNSISPGYTLSVFEPIDEFKGDIARMILYAAVRYQDMIPTFDYLNGRSPFHERHEMGIKPWLLQQLILWHNSDPVSTKELKRNEAIYQIQGNRNPFIDHPEWVNAIWNDSTVDTTAPEPPIYLELYSKGQSFLHFHWADAHEADVIGYEVYINDTLHARTANNYFVFTHLESMTDYAIQVKAYDHKYNTSPFSLSISATTSATDTFSRDLYFSKIIEGDANNKAIEIHNNTGYPVDLKHYNIGMRQINSITGAMYWSDNEYQLEGTLAHGQRLVLMNPKSTLSCIDKAEVDFLTAATPLTFTGNLALSLNKGENAIDYFGAVSNREPFFEDESWYRKPSAKQPTTTFTPSEWLVYPTNYCEGLGSHQANSSDDILAINNIKIFPNPAQSGSILTLDLSALSTPKIEVHLSDNLGKMIHQWSLHPGLQSIQLPNLTAGTYYLNLAKQVYKLTIL